MNQINNIYHDRDRVRRRQLLRKIDLFNLSLYSEEIRRYFSISSLRIEHSRILDFGCGIGARLLEFYRVGADIENLYGFDCNPERLQKARQLMLPSNIFFGDNAHVPVADNSFDIVINSTMMSSILDDNEACTISKEFTRILRPNGIIVWFDLAIDNPFNPNVRSYSRTAIKGLFPDFHIIKQKKLCLPPLPITNGLPYSVLSLLHFVLFFRSHHFMILRRKSSS